MVGGARRRAGPGGGRGQEVGGARRRSPPGIPTEAPLVSFCINVILTLILSYLILSYLTAAITTTTDVLWSEVVNEFEYFRRDYRAPDELPELRV